MSDAYLTAHEAAAELNVSRATLYAYVSRGLVDSRPAPDGRHRLYRADDVRALRGRKSGRGPGARDGTPANDAVLASSITLIENGRLYYRGRDAAALARTMSLEALAGLLWQAPSDPFAAPAPTLPPVANTSALARAVAALATAQEADLRAFNLAPEAVAETGARIVRLLAAAFGARIDASSIADGLAAAWHVPQAMPLLRAALVLSADHELNASTYAARVVASTLATPYAVTIAGLAALQGPRHGGQRLQVQALLREAAAAATPRDAVVARLQRGDPLPGFGHPLYPAGDPRARALNKLIAEGLSLPSRVVEVEAAVADLTGLAPNIDFALAALCAALDLTDEAPFILFATGRAAGWIAHAIEQYTSPGIIRPRANYVGEPPSDAKP
jgi:citrate synthase